MQRGAYHFFLGGHDLEMETIRALGVVELDAARVHDRGLSWGAKASAYEAEITAALDDGATPVLVELIDDLAPGIDRSRLVIVDHHGALAGADRPCSLRQIFDLLGLPEPRWTRSYRLVAANDIGHMRALREAGATAVEIRAIRDADRAAQGATADDEAAARRAIGVAKAHGALLVVPSETARTSPILDFLEPEYGGTGARDVLVFAPETVGFYGRGNVVGALAGQLGSWWGGALPERGFWGAHLTDPAVRQRLQVQILRLLS